MRAVLFAGAGALFAALGAEGHALYMVDKNTTCLKPLRVGQTIMQLPAEADPILPIVSNCRFDATL